MQDALLLPAMPCLVQKNCESKQNFDLPCPLPFLNSQAKGK